MPHFTAKLSPPQKDCAGPGLLFPRQKVGNDGEVQPVHTQLLPKNAECCGAALRGDGGGFFGICCFALAWPLPACEGGIMPEGVAAGP